MRNLSFIGLVAALLIVGVVVRRQLLATRQLAPTPVSAPLASPGSSTSLMDRTNQPDSANQSSSDPNQQRSQATPAAIADSVQNALHEAMRGHEQRLRVLDDAQND